MSLPPVNNLAGGVVVVTVLGACGEWCSGSDSVRCKWLVL